MKQVSTKFSTVIFTKMLKKLLNVKKLNKCLRMEYKCICIYNEQKHYNNFGPKKPGLHFGYFDEKNFNNDFYFSVKMTKVID